VEVFSSSSSSSSSYYYYYYYYYSVAPPSNADILLGFDGESGYTKSNDERETKCLERS